MRKLFPVMANLQKDELFSFWVEMLAIMNGYRPNEFLRDFMQYPAQNRIIRTDHILNLDYVCRIYQEYGFPDVAEVLKEHSDYCTCLPFRRKNDNLLLSQSILRSTEEKRLIPYARRTKAGAYRICPECRKEDQKICGRPYVHVWHNLPGVSCCAVHKCMLYDIESPNMDFVPANEESLRIAEFMYQMYQTPSDHFLENTIEIVKDRDLNAGYLLNKTSTDVSDIVRIVSDLFSAEEFSKRLEEKMNVFHASDVASGHIEKRVCPVCGHCYHISTEAEKAGYGCPKCDRKLTLSALAGRLVRCHGDQKYELVSMPDDRHGVIRHKPCGQERTMLLDNFLWKSVRCPVCVSLSCEHWQNEIDPEIKKFQITDYRMNGKNQVLTVKHVGRGHSFEVKPALLQKYPFCRICESYHTGDSFMNLVNQEPGFELVGPYSEKGVDVLHERCGTISRVRPEHWRKGQRCLLCGNQRKGKYYLRSDVYLVLRELGTASAEDIYQNERIKTYRKGAGWIRKLLQALERDQYVECEDGLYHVAEPIVHNLRITRPEEHTTRTCKDRTGAVSVARNGQTMTVIAYRSCKDCDIQFEDGTIVKGVEYRYFKAGEIGNPNYRYRKWNKKKKEDE